jgi:tetratricopeptide (TPR) repeat protein
MQPSKESSRKSGRSAARPAVPVVEPRRAVFWPYGLGVAIALAVAFEVYGPALNGPFLFDDQYLLFKRPDFVPDSLRAWISGVRPLLMFTYWINYQLSGERTFWYHVFNVLFHGMVSILVFFVVRKILEWAQVDGVRRDVLAVFAGALFLLHPVNSESVGYVASRSENLSVLFFLGAFALFLYRRSAEITWTRTALVLVVFGAAVLSKEHTVVLLALLLLTDYFWNPPFSLAGIRRNWRLYVPVTLAGALAVVYLARQLRGATSAGFRIKEFTWYQYFFTECRAFWLYIRLFLFPAGLRIDYDYPVSHTILEHGAVVGLAAIVLAAGAAFYFRRRYPLAAYGFFAFVILMAPTSSFVPIADPVAERRLYLSMIGLLLIVTEFLRRVDVKRPRWMASLAGVLLLAGTVTYNRNFVWSDKVVLWEDTAAKSPGKSRVEFQLAQAYYEHSECDKALPHYERSAALDSTDYRLFIDWGLAYDCLNQPEQALTKFKYAASMKATAHAYSQIGMVYGKQGKNTEALDALATAERIDPYFDMTYVYRAGVRISEGNPAAAIEDFHRALALNPRNQTAQQALAMIEAQRNAARP